MAFMGILVVMGIISVVLVILLFWVAVFMLGGLLEGILVYKLGGKLVKSEGAMAKRPAFVKTCRVLGLASAIVCGAAILLGIVLFILPAFMRGADTGLSDAGALFAVLTGILVLLGFLLFVTMGVLLLRIFRLNGQVQPPPLHKGLAIFCGVLGVIGIVASAFAVLTVGAGILLFS